MKYVIIYGSVFEGVQGVVGPFDSEAAAEEYMEAHNLGHFDKGVFELEDFL